MAVIIFKATEGCNARCAYCDVVQRKKRGDTLPLELLELVFERINEYLEENPGEKIELVWHGGEPLLLGPGYFEKALEFQEKHCAGTKARLEHAVQSNLTLLTGEYIDIFRKLGIKFIGTSFEPLPHVRGMGKNQDSLKYNRMFMKAASMLEEAGLGYGFIYVVTRKSLKHPLRLFYFLTNLNVPGGFNMNPVLIYDRERQDLKITPAEYADFLGAIFPEWWKHWERFPSVEPFTSLVKNTTGPGLSLNCGESGNCARNHLNIDPHGNISQCGRASDWGILPYGSIIDRKIDEVLHDERRGVLLDRVTMLKKGECSGCRFWFICHGGCPLDAWSRNGSFMRKTEWCEAKVRFIEKYFEPVTGIKVNGNEKEKCE